MWSVPKGTYPIGVCPECFKKQLGVNSIVGYKSPYLCKKCKEKFDTDNKRFWGICQYCGVKAMMYKMSYVEAIKTCNSG